MRTDGGSREDGLTGLAMFHVKHRVVQRYAIHDFCRSISANISFAVKNRMFVPICRRCRCRTSVPIMKFVPIVYLRVLLVDSNSLPENRSECAARDTRWFAYLLRIVLLHWWVKYIDAG